MYFLWLYCYTYHGRGDVALKGDEASRQELRSAKLEATIADLRAKVDELRSAR